MQATIGVLLTVGIKDDKTIPLATFAELTNHQNVELVLPGVESLDVILRRSVMRNTPTATVRNDSNVEAQRFVNPS